MQIQNKPLVIIGGINRSGTSLMRQLIGSHSRIAIPPTEFEFFKKLDIETNKSMSDQEFKSALDRLLSLTKIKMWGLDEKEVRLSATGIEPNWRNLFILTLDGYRHKLNKDIIGEKTTYNELHLKTFDEWFNDNYKFIHLVRNPVNTFASNKYYNGKIHKIDPVTWSLNWIQSVKIGMTRWVSKPSQHILVRFENLITRQEETLKNICNFLGLELELERMLSMCDFQTKDNSSFRDKKEKKKNSIKKDGIDRLSKLTSYERNTLLEICGPLAELLGYDTSAWVQGQTRRTMAYLANGSMRTFYLRHPVKLAKLLIKKFQA